LDEENVQPIAENCPGDNDSRGVDNEEFPTEEFVEKNQVRNTDSCTTDDERDDGPNRNALVDEWGGISDEAWSGSGLDE
jgi:hypothetical protein